MTVRVEPLCAKLAEKAEAGDAALSERGIDVLEVVDAQNTLRREWRVFRRSGCALAWRWQICRRYGSADDAMRTANKKEATNGSG